MVECLEGIVFFASLIQGALRDGQLLTQSHERLAFFIMADSFDFEFGWVWGRHSLSSFVGVEDIVTKSCRNVVDVV